MRNILRGTLCCGGSGGGGGGEDPLANQEVPPPGNTSLKVPGGSSDQQDEPLGNPSTEVSGGGDPPTSPTFLLVFPFRPSSGQPASRPTFVVFLVFRQVEPSSIRLLVRLQVRFPSDCHGHAPLSPHRVAIDVPASPDVQEDASQVEVKEARLVEEEDPPQGNTLLEVPGGISDQQDEPLGNTSTEVRGGGNPPASHTFLLVFPLRPSLGQPPSRPTFVMFPVFRQVEPSSIRLLVRPQVRFPSYSHGHALLSPHRVAIAIPASIDEQEEASQVEVEEARQVDKARRVEEAADPSAPVEEQAQLAVPLRPVILDFFRFPGIPGQQQLRDQESLEDPPQGNTLLEVPGGINDQQDEPLGNPSTELLVRPQVRFPSYSHGHALLSPHRVAIAIPASTDVQEEASQVEVEDARQVDKARRVEEAADPPALVEEQAQLAVPLRPVIPDFFRYWNQIVQSLQSLIQYVASFRGLGDEGASTSRVGNATNMRIQTFLLKKLAHRISRTDPILIMRNILRGSLCGGGSGRGRGSEDPLANQEDPPPGNTSLEVPGGCSDQQDEPLGNPSTEVRGGGDPLANPTFLLVFPFRPSSGQPASRPTFVVFPVFRQVEPSSIRLPVWFPSDSYGHAPLSPHRVALDVAASADVQEDASQVEVEEAADTPALDQQDEPLGNPSTEVRSGGNPPASHTFLLVFPLRPSSGQPPSRPTFVVFSVFRQIEPSSIRFLVRPQVRFPSDSHGHAPLSPHRVAIAIPASADVQEEASQVEVEEARRVEEAADTPTL
nr:hypothetical protein Iba_chr10dCG14180 [Ipomoea batatas]